MVGYENAARINAAGYQVFGSDLPNILETTEGYTHNLAAWPGSVWDFSGVPLAATVSPDIVARGVGALITPRHLLGAHHYTSTAGDVYFVTPGGTVITRSVSAVSSQIGTDIKIITLNEAVEGCAIYKLPTAESMASIIGATIWCLKQPRTLVTRRLSAAGANTIQHQTDSTGGVLVSGDSGQAAFITVGTELVLLSTHHQFSGGVGTSPNVAQNLAAIQSYCDATSQTIQTVSVDPATWVQPLDPVRVF